MPTSLSPHCSTRPALPTRRTGSSAALQSVRARPVRARRRSAATEPLQRIIHLVGQYPARERGVSSANLLLSLNGRAPRRRIAAQREYEFRSASGTPCVEPPLMCRCNLLADGKSEPRALVSTH